MKKTIITTSWDDGNKLDLKVLDLLDKYGLRGTFYIPKSHQSKTLSDPEINVVCRRQEVGAHTLNHVNLSAVDLTTAREEIRGSKDYLEDLTGKDIEMFCYPFGHFNNEVRQEVKAAGFLGARTTKEFDIRYPDDFFSFNTSLHIYPFPFRKRDESHYHLSKFLFQPLQKKYSGIRALGLPLRSWLSWDNLSRSVFDHALEINGLYHIWGHSWEIERYGLWDKLESHFKYISRRDDCLYLTNGEALKFNPQL